MSELTRITQLLAENRVDFVVAGGLATILHGSALLTRDVDVACDMAPDNLLRVWTAVQHLHPVHRMTPARLPFTRELAQKGGLNNLYLSTDLGQIDLLGEIKGLGDFAACLQNSESIVIGEVSIRVLSLDALIRAKRAMGRPRDLHAVLELEVIRERLRGSRSDP